MLQEILHDFSFIKFIGADSTAEFNCVRAFCCQPIRRGLNVNMQLFRSLCKLSFGQSILGAGMLQNGIPLHFNRMVITTMRTIKQQKLSS